MVRVDLHVVVGILGEMLGEALRPVAYLVELDDELVVVDVLALVAVVGLDDAFGIVDVNYHVIAVPNMLRLDDEPVHVVMECGRVLVRVVEVIDAEVRFLLTLPARACVQSMLPRKATLNCILHSGICAARAKCPAPFSRRKASLMLACTCSRGLE
eukprot:1490374-Amphidinium_carterae.2